MHKTRYFPCFYLFYGYFNSFRVKDKNDFTANFNKKRKYSNWSREGLTQSLILVGRLGDSIRIPNLNKPQYWVDNIVLDLLYNATGETWVSVDHELPLISEASPDSFLKSVNNSLAKEKPEIMEEISNSGKLAFMNQNKAPISEIFKSVNKLTLQQKNSEPLRFQTVDGADMLVVSANRSVAINSLTTTENASVYVVGDALFNGPIYYDGARLVQAFVVDKSSVVDPALEVRSVKSLRIDEESGIGLAINDEDNSITISSPGYYRKIYETPLLDGIDPDSSTAPEYIEPAGKDIIEFKD